MESTLINHQIGILVFLMVLLIFALLNFFSIQNLEKEAASCPEPFMPPKVSILLPARNEEDNVRACVTSLLQQDYQNFEVIVLDDHSQDKTYQILTSLAEEYDCLRILKGKPLPQDWLGKPWACQQLAEAAGGYLLLFTDSDTRHHPHTLKEAVKIAEFQKLDLLSILPYQVLSSWGEWVTIPILYWSFMAFVPLPLAYRLKHPSLSMAIGQFLLFRRSALDIIGGFKAVKGTPADDLALVRRVKRFGLRWKVDNGINRVTTHMYSGYTQAFRGIGKNLFAAFDYRIMPFLFVWLWLFIVFIEPTVIFVFSLIYGKITLPSLYLATTSIAISILLWGIASIRFRFSLLITLIFPVIILVNFSIAIYSLLATLNGGASWKGRNLFQQHARWF